MSTASPARITWVDHAKGVGIVLVVLGHTLGGLLSGGVLADGPAVRAVISWIYSFHMPLFFLLSGLFAGRGVGRGAGRFLRDKMDVIVYPYLVWSVLQTLVQLALSRHTNHPASPYDIAWVLVEPVKQFWFLYALFLISLIDYVLRRCGLGARATLLAFLAFWSTQGWASLGPWGPLDAARRNGVYYALGSVVNDHGGAERLSRAPTPALLLTVVLGYGIVTASVSRVRGVLLPADLAVTLCGIAASVALAVLFSRGRGLDFVRVLGAYSLEIYVAHTIVSAGIRLALQKVLKVQDATAHVAIGTVGGLALPLLLGLVCRGRRAEYLFRIPRRGARPRPGPA